MENCHLHKLPNELLLQIFAEVADLNGPPPSASKFAQEPSTELTKSANQRLKILSLVCSRWRGATLPYLFQFSRVCLSCDAGWLRLCTGLSKWIKGNCRKTAKTLALVKKMDDLAESLNTDAMFEPNADRPLGFEFTPKSEDVWPAEYYHWLPTAKLEVEMFLKFVQEHGITHKVKSLTVFAHRNLTEDRSSLEESIIYWEVKTLWREVFRVLPLQQIIVAAPPSTMAALSGGIDRAWDSWLFQMPYHYLKFSRPPDSSQAVELSGSSPPPSPQGRSREKFLYNIQPWTHMSYNEGTSLRGYGHYEYQWKKPPHIFPSLITWLVKERKSPRTPKIESIEYISIFPYASHLRHFILGLASLEYLRELTVKLAEPDLLENAELMGKAQSSDVYNEWDGCYRIIGHHFLAVAREGTVFVALDTKHGTLKDQIRDCFERRSIVPLTNRLVVEEHEDVLTWRVR